MEKQRDGFAHRVGRWTSLLSLLWPWLLLVVSCSPDAEPREIRLQIALMGLERATSDTLAARENIVAVNELTAHLGEIHLEQLPQLIAECEQRSLRGAVTQYRAQAEVELELENLNVLRSKPCCRELELPGNHFEVLDQPTLVELDKRYQAKYELLAKAAAASPPGIYDAALQDVEARLRSLREAMGRPTFDIARHYHRARDSISDPDIAARFGKQDASARALEIAVREQMLLEKAQAKTNDPAVYLRLQELKTASSKLAHQLGQVRRPLIMERADGLRPLFTNSQDIGELIRNRFADPLRAVRSEAVLRMHWQELLENTDAAARQRLLPGELAYSFPDWLVSQVNDEELETLSGYAMEALEYLARIDVNQPQDVLGRLDIDRRAVMEFFEAIQREFQYRKTHGLPRGARIDLAQESSDLQEILRRQAALNPEVAIQTPAGRQAHFEALSQYLARVVLPSSEALALHRELTLHGYQDHVEQFEKECRWLQGETDKYRGEGEHDLSAQGYAAWSRALEVLHAKAWLIRQSLLRMADGDSRESLLARLDLYDHRVMQHRATSMIVTGLDVVEDVTVKPANRTVAPFADVELLRMSNEFARLMTQLVAPSRAPAADGWLAASPVGVGGGESSVVAIDTDTVAVWPGDPNEVATSIVDADKSFSRRLAEILSMFNAFLPSHAIPSFTPTQTLMPMPMPVPVR